MAGNAACNTNLVGLREWLNGERPAEANLARGSYAPDLSGAVGCDGSPLLFLGRAVVPNSAACSSTKDGMMT